MCSATFASSPALLGVVVQLLWIGLCLFGIGLSVFASLIMIEPGFFVRALVVPVIVTAGLGAVCFDRCRRGVRQWRMRRLAVKLVITRADLILIDPPQWGTVAQVYPIDSVLSISSEFAGWWLGGAPSLHRINVAFRQSETKELCVSVADVDVFHRTIDELQENLKQRIVAASTTTQAEETNDSCASSF
jgi:hypothetical protein